MIIRLEKFKKNLMGGGYPPPPPLVRPRVNLDDDLVPWRFVQERARGERLGRRFIFIFSLSPFRFFFVFFLLLPSLFLFCFFLIEGTHVT